MIFFCGSAASRKASEPRPCLWIWKQPLNGGELSASRSTEELPLPILDGLIAATAYMSGAILVPRNTKDFRNLAIQTLNPWL